MEIPNVTTKERKIIQLNGTNLSSFHPLAYPTPGFVTVKVLSSAGRVLGETSFKYTDMIEDILKKLVHDTRMQRRFFHCWAQELGNVLSEPENLQPGDTEFKKSGMHGLSKTLGLFYLFYVI